MEYKVYLFDFDYTLAASSRGIVKGKVSSTSLCITSNVNPKAAKSSFRRGEAEPSTIL